LSFPTAGVYLVTGQCTFANGITYTSTAITLYNLIWLNSSGVSYTTSQLYIPSMAPNTSQVVPLSSTVLKVTNTTSNCQICWYCNWTGTANFNITSYYLAFVRIA
jgi:hypothetical protein